MKEVDENGYTYLGILELDEIKEQKMKIKVKEVEADIEIQIEW